MIVIPSILTDSLDTVSDQVEKTLSIRLHRVQIDIIDPAFADEITIHPIDLLGIDLKGIEVDIHLMTNEPINDVVECSQVPGIKTVIAQIERMPDQKAFVEHVQSFSIHPGLSVDAYTELEEIDEEVMNDLSIIQVMGNRAGHQGQQFLGEPILKKIQTLDTLRKEKGLSFQIAVDIGMSPDHARACEKVGADIVTPGSYLWTAQNLQRAIESYGERL